MQARASNTGALIGCATVTEALCPTSWRGHVMSENLTEPAATCDCRSRELLQRCDSVPRCMFTAARVSGAAPPAPNSGRLPFSRAGQGSAGRSALPKVAAFGAAPRGSQLRRPGAGNCREDSLSQGGMQQARDQCRTCSTSTVICLPGAAFVFCCQT